MKNDGENFAAPRLQCILVDTQFRLDLFREIIDTAVRKVVEVFEDPALHFLCGLIGERYGKNKPEIFRLPTECEQYITFGECAGLPRASGGSIYVECLGQPVNIII